MNINFTFVEDKTGGLGIDLKILSAIYILLS